MTKARPERGGPSLCFGVIYGADRAALLCQRVVCESLGAIRSAHATVRRL